MTDEERRIEEARAMGQAMQPTIGPNGLPLPNTDMTVTKEPHKVTENETKALSAPATEALGKADAAAEAAKSARMSTIPVEGVAHELNLTPDELTSVGGLGGQINQGQMQDLINTRQTALEEQAAAKHQAELDAIAKKAEEARQKAIIDQADRWKAVAEKASAAEMFDNRSVGTRILQGIAVGMEMYARIRSGIGGESQILKNIQAEIDRDAAARKAKLNAAIETAKAAGTRPEAIDKWAKQQNDDANQRKVAQLEWAKAQMGKLAALYPAKSRELQMAQAEIDKGVAEKRAELLVAHTETSNKTQRFGQEVTRTEGTRVGGGQAGGGQATRETINELAATRMQIKALDEREEIIKRNPKAWEAYRDAVKAQDEAEIAKGTPLGKMLITHGQGVGYVAMAVDQRLDTIEDPQLRADAKRLNQVEPVVQTAQARISDPVGVLNEAAQVNARKTMNIYTATPDEALKIAKPFRAQFVEKEGLLSAGAPVQRAEATMKAREESSPRVSPGGQTKAQKDYTEKTKREIAEDKAAKNKGARISAADKEALAWAAANPKDPRSAQIIKKIRGNVTRGE